MKAEGGKEDITSAFHILTSAFSFQGFGTPSVTPETKNQKLKDFS